jgi:hypothetical protein
MLAPLRAVVGDDLPTMPGANVLGPARDGSVVLWSHPNRTVKGGKMPVLALGDVENGRSIAMGVDGTWMLEFSELGARTAGRGHGALWDGLLGWLMRDPRFEPAQLELGSGCTAGVATTLRTRLMPKPADAPPETVDLKVARVDDGRGQGKGPPLGKVLTLQRVRPEGSDVVAFPLPPLEAGGYVARLRVNGGPTTRRDFACEAGGDEWADSRPDPARLRALAAATGGAFAWASDAGSLPWPKPTVVSAERHVVPLAPPWVWTLLAAIALGAHWFARRRSGLS